MSIWPYKTNVGASFPWNEETAAGASPDRHGIGGYFHLEPGEIFVGGGMWRPEKARLDAFRRAVASNPDEAAGALEASEFVAAFGGIGGMDDALRRVPAGYPADHPRADWLRLRSVVFGRRLSDAEATSPALPGIVADAFAAAVPVFRYLARVTAGA